MFQDDVFIADVGRAVNVLSEVDAVNVFSEVDAVNVLSEVVAVQDDAAEQNMAPPSASDQACSSAHSSPTYVVVRPTATRNRGTDELDRIMECTQEELSDKLALNTNRWLYCMHSLWNGLRSDKKEMRDFVKAISLIVNSSKHSKSNIIIVEKKKYIARSIHSDLVTIDEFEEMKNAYIQLHKKVMQTHPELLTNLEK